MNWRYGRTLLLGLIACLLLVYCAVAFFNADMGTVLWSMLMCAVLLACVIFTAALVIVIAYWLRTLWRGARSQRGFGRRTIKAKPSR